MKTPFVKFTAAKGKYGVLTNHAQTRYHQDACVRAKALLSTHMHPNTRIDAALDQERQKLSDRNKHVLEAIVDTILLCGRQDISLRGHRDDCTAELMSNRGNFIAILETKAKSDDVLRSHLETGNRNQRYTSKTIQNDVIDIIADVMREKLLLPLKQSRHYSVIADEVTDSHSNQEIMSLCLRFVDCTLDKAEVKEIFVDFMHVERATGQKLADCIISMLAKLGLPIEDMRGQAYDGAAAMSSSNVGVHANIKRLNPLALYTHCNSHVLNLAIAGSCSVQSLRNMVGYINDVFLFFHLSPKRQRFLEQVLGVYAPEQRRHKLKGLCKTRWVERHDCLETLVSLLVYVVTCLHAMTEPTMYPDLPTEDWKWDQETRNKATGLKCALVNFQNIVALVVLQSGLGTVKGLSSKLQKRNSDIYHAYQMIDSVITDVVEMRESVDTVWGEWYGEACSLAEKLGSEPAMPRITSVQRNRANVPADTPRHELFFRFVMGILIIYSVLFGTQGASP